MLEVNQGSITGRRLEIAGENIRAVRIHSRLDNTAGIGITGRNVQSEAAILRRIGTNHGTAQKSPTGIITGLQVAVDKQILPGGGCRNRQSTCREHGKRQ